MSAPLYFLPSVAKDAIAPAGKLNHSKLAERGVGHVFAGLKGLSIDTACNELARGGPGGMPGVILCALPTSGKAPGRVGYYPNDQVWTPWLDGSQVWIGTDPSDPPGPNCIARASRFSGHIVELADGHRYEVPVIRAPGTNDTSLPRTMGWNSDGAFELIVKDEYRSAWEESERTITLIYGFGEEGHGQISWQDALLMSIRALSLNYRYGRLEQNVLRLIDTANWQKVLGATVDWPKIEAMSKAQKKSESSPENHSSPSSSPGDAGSPDTGQENTGPAGQTSTSPD